MKRILVLPLLLSLLAPITVAQVRQLSLTDLCKHADRVVIGGVTKMEARWVGQKIVTDVTIVPTETLKGAGNLPFIITVPGGTIGTVTLRASEAPTFSVGEQVVVFPKTGAPGGVYGWYRGKFTVVDGSIRELLDTTLAQFRSQLETIIESL